MRVMRADSQIPEFFTYGHTMSQASQIRLPSSANSRHSFNDTATRGVTGHTEPALRIRDSQVSRYRQYRFGQPNRGPADTGQPRPYVRQLPNGGQPGRNTPPRYRATIAIPGRRQMPPDALPRDWQPSPNTSRRRNTSDAGGCRTASIIQQSHTPTVERYRELVSHEQKDDKAEHILFFLLLFVFRLLFSIVPSRQHFSATRGTHGCTTFTP